MVERGSVIFRGDEDDEIGEDWVGGDTFVKLWLLLLLVVDVGAGALGSYEQNDSRFLERQFAQGSPRSHWLQPCQGHSIV